MNAKEALELTKSVWAENEIENLEKIKEIDLDKGIEICAKKGWYNCVVGVFPDTQFIWFLAYYLEQLGHFVSISAYGNDLRISVDWKNIPINSRANSEMKEIAKLLE